MASLQGSDNYIWSLHDILGQGATGAVYKARHKVNYIIIIIMCIKFLYKDSNIGTEQWCRAFNPHQGLSWVWVILNFTSYYFLPDVFFRISSWNTHKNSQSSVIVFKNSVIGIFNPCLTGDAICSQLLSCTRWRRSTMWVRCGRRRCRCGSWRCCSSCTTRTSYSCSPSRRR